MNTKTEIQLRRVIRDATSFAEKVDALVDETGMSRGKAILFCRSVDPKAYNQWQGGRVTDRIREKPGGQSVMSFFRFVGA